MNDRAAQVHMLAARAHCTFWLLVLTLALYQRLNLGRKGLPRSCTPGLHHHAAKGLRSGREEHAFELQDARLSCLVVELGEPLRHGALADIREVPVARVPPVEGLVLEAAWVRSARQVGRGGGDVGPACEAPVAPWRMLSYWGRFWF